MKRAMLSVLASVAASQVVASELPPADATYTDNTNTDGAVETLPPVLAAFTHGELKLAVRYRFEQVDDDAFAREARASTLRTRLTYRTAAWQRWSATFEGDDVRSIGDDRYNSTRNGETQFPLVPDPKGTELNQALLQYTGDRYGLVLGRQRVNFDDQRFIGSSAWRQNEQTLDGATARVRLPRLDVTYNYASNVNRTNGPQSGTPPADLHGDTQLLNARLDAGSFGSVTVFDYRLDFDNAPALSSNTIGARWSGNRPLHGALRFTYQTSFAQQTDIGENPTDSRTQYWLLEAGLKLRTWSVSAGRESLSGNANLPNRSFQTPLATLHAFQGWADKFTTTPAQGIDDTYASVAVTNETVRAQLTYHDYRSQAARVDYGNEWNAMVWVQLAKRYELLFKAAHYESNGFAADTNKFWFQLITSF